MGPPCPDPRLVQPGEITTGPSQVTGATDIVFPVGFNFVTRQFCAFTLFRSWPALAPGHEVIVHSVWNRNVFHMQRDYITSLSGIPRYRGI